MHSSSGKRHLNLGVGGAGEHEVSGGWQEAERVDRLVAHVPRVEQLLGQEAALGRVRVGEVHALVARRGQVRAALIVVHRLHCTAHNTIKARSVSTSEHPGAVRDTWRNVQRTVQRGLLLDRRALHADALLRLPLRQVLVEHLLRFLQLRVQHCTRLMLIRSMTKSVN